MSKISFIIPTLNEERHIGKLLKDLSLQTVKKIDSVETIVVDGGSKDKTCRIVQQHPNVTLIRTTAGVGHQRDLGASKAKGEYLIFLDADVRIIKPNFIETIINFLNIHNLAVVCPYYWPHNSTFSIKCVYTFFNALFYLFQKISPSGAGSCIATSSLAFKKAGGFNPDLKFDDIAFIRTASSIKKFGFGMVPIAIEVSDRRFRKHGVGKMILVYLVLSLFFLFNQFKAAEIVEYKFNHY